MITRMMSWLRTWANDPTVVEIDREAPTTGIEEYARRLADRYRALL